MNQSTKRLLSVSIVAAVFIVLAATAGYFIGRSDGQSTASTAPTVAGLAIQASNTTHNIADTMFVQGMIPHHDQALEMARLADTRASSPVVKQLASAIEGAQQPEIDKMQSWLKNWGTPDMGGMNMGGMSGTMSQADMDRLKSLQGTAFDQAFLTMMTSHHNGAISMANDELRNGECANVLALAASIAITQQAEVDYMAQLLS